MEKPVQQKQSDRQPAAPAPSERETAEARLAEAQAADTEALARITAARRALDQATSTWESCAGSSEEVEAARQLRDDARRRLDQIEREGERGRTAKQLEIARSNLEKVVAAERRSMLEFLRPKLAAYKDARTAIEREWIAIDRAIGALAAKTLSVKDDYAGLHAQAAALATALGEPHPYESDTPTSEGLAVEIQKAVS